MQLVEVVEEQTQKLAASATDVLGMTEGELEDAAEAYRCHVLSIPHTMP